MYDSYAREEKSEEIKYNASVEQPYIQEIENPKEAMKPPIKEEPSDHNQSRRAVWNASDKLLVAFFTLAFSLLNIFYISSGIEVSELDRSIQEVNQSIQQTEIENDNYEQNVQELSQYDRIYEIAEKNGLKLNEQNVRNVAE